jgi:putative CocE/NonD family hydrolase
MPARTRFAEHGYATVMVDMRGTGCSGGAVRDPFDSQREGRDGAETVAWAIQQPWCNGRIGVWGMSYGAITALSTAAQRPQGLEAIVPVMGGSDMYSDFFYKGGCETCLAATVWGAADLLALQLAPPLAEDPDGNFERRWRTRMEDGQLTIWPWREHRERDAYWQERRIDLSAIEVPAFLIGGWRDVYPDAVLRAYGEISAPCRLLMGPWRHELPDESGREPYDYLSEVTRWWDRWLRDEEVTPESPSPVRVFVQGVDVWKDEDHWPLPGTAERVLFMVSDGTLASSAEVSGANLTYDGDPTVGVYADDLYVGADALDQRPDDERSMTWTGEPLPEPLEITGTAEVLLRFAIEEGDDVNLVARLCDVAPDATSTLIATGWSRASRLPTAVRDADGLGAQERRIAISATSYRLAAGHRLRVCLACSDFPRIWPTQSNPRIRIYMGGPGAPSSVRIPVVPPRPGTDIAPPRPRRQAADDPVQATATWNITTSPDGAETAVAISLKADSELPSGREQLEQDIFAHAATDRPESTLLAVRVTIRRELPSGSEATTHVNMVATPDGTACKASVISKGELLFEREWNRDDPLSGADADRMRPSRWK